MDNRNPKAEQYWKTVEELAEGKEELTFGQWLTIFDKASFILKYSDTDKQRSLCWKVKQDQP